jgi:glycosyltransferase involved in cell wall biosynthesis
MRVSVIVPVLNERDAVRPLVEALFGQTRAPDEVVVADGGSDDGTREILHDLAQGYANLRVVSGPGGISENRNAAIRAATGEVIACTDAGCLPEPGWLEALAKPFESGADWVAGFYRPEGKTTASTAAGVVMMTVLEEVDMDHFLPGGSSQAFTKEAWARVGGFPEGINAGEDTLYGEQLRAAGYRPEFAPDALVAWHPPSSLEEMAAKARLWGEADGINRVRTGAYLRVIGAYWILPLVAVVAASFFPLLGLAILIAFLAMIVFRTRFKYRWVSGWSRWFLIPIAHVRQQLSQSLGFLEGFGPGNLLKKMAGRLLRPVRRLLPESWVQNLAAESRPLRHNVDVWVESDTLLTRWLEDTPATYRVGTGGPKPGGAVVQATVELRPGLEPLVSPVAVSLPEVLVRDLSEEPQILNDPVASYSVLRQSGHRYSLVPSPGGLPHRKDNVMGTASLIVLAAVPMHDVGGGSRGSQIAQEAASRDMHVTYLSRFDAAESVDLGLRFIHPRLEEMAYGEFEVDSFLARDPQGPRIVLVEFPHRDYKPIVEALWNKGFRIVYDLIDDWDDATLGGWWYDHEFVEWLIGHTHLLTASAPSLVRSLRDKSGRDVLEVPNGVNPRVFDIDAEPSVPRDLPPGSGPLFEYHGSLYGNWFDWSAVISVARAFPEARVILIGDRPRRYPELPANVHLLGLKPQEVLPSYLAQADVGLIPFVVSKTTHAVSPLKAFEYLAMGVPVAAPPLEPLDGLDSVHTHTDLAEAVRRAMRAPRPVGREALARHGWGERLGRLLAELEVELPPLARPVRIEVHPVFHYAKEDRILR